MALVVQISTYEELKKIIAESGKEYDREQIEAGSRSAARGSPTSSTPCLWRLSWWALAWIPSR